MPSLLQRRRRFLLFSGSGTSLVALAYASSEVGAVDNSTVVVTFNKAPRSPSAGTSAGVTIKVNGSAVTIPSQGTISGSTISYPIDTTVYADDTVTWEYDASVGDLEAVDGGGELSSLGAQSVTNTTAAFLITDAFNRADSAATLGSTDTGEAWTAHVGTWGIETNRAYVATGAGDNVATVEASRADGYVQAVFAVAANNQRLVFRYAGTGDHWLVQRESGTSTTIYKKVAGAFTLMATVAVGLAGGETVKATFSGSTIKLFINGTEQTTVTDSAHSTATRHGLGSFSTGTFRWDDFEVGP